MTGREFLHELRKERAAYWIVKERYLEKRKVIYEVSAPPTDAARVQKPVTDRMARQFEAMESLKEELCESLEIVMAMEEQARAEVARVPGEIEGLILYQRYLVALDWSDIMNLMELQRSRLFDLHRVALEQYDAIHEEKEFG